MKKYLYKLNQNYDNSVEPQKSLVLFVPLVIVVVGDYLLNYLFQTPQGILLLLLIAIMSIARAAYIYKWLQPKEY